MYYKLIILCLLASGWVSSARADNCANPATQADISSCSGAALKNTDAEMNTIYRDVIARLKTADAAKQRLIASQKFWLQYRDAQCAFAANAAKQGSIYPTVVQNCRSALTVDRIKALKAYLTCREGDPSCPCQNSDFTSGNSCADMANRSRPRRLKPEY